MLLRHASELAPPPQVQKRQRLCSDSDEESLAGSMTEVSSRFFATTGEPTVTRRDTTSKKLKSNKLHVYSDQDATLSPGQTLGGDQAKHSTAIDNPPPGPPAFTVEPTPNGNPQEVSTSLSKATSSSLQTIVGSRSVDADSDPSLFESVLDYNIERHNLNLREKYAFKPLEQRETVQANGGPVQSTPVLGQLPGKSVKRTLSSQSRATPLQRLKQSALARSKSMNSLQPRVLDDRPEDAVEPVTNSPSPARRTISQVGSEDMILPSSDSLNEETDSQEPAYSFDFSKYAFNKA
ncbi:hypothetical protein FQN49_008808 [Arthroderma sp. PD_2]|nr:hypothetical protein FQN49_008808 [Arthroderma sp. PD_2]